MNKGGDAGDIEALSVTANGTYTASGNVKGYSPVSVSVQPNVGTKSISDNGTYTASADQLDGYSSVTVAVSKDFYPKSHATLDDASRVEGDDMRVYPMGGTDYYPYVYLGAMPYPAQQGDDFEPCGKYFAGQSTEHIASIFLDLIDVETGESATGYPQQVAPTQANFSILSGGWARIKAWSVTSNASQVSITIERFNPTYTKPIENTYTSVSVTPLDALQSYLNTSYYIAAGMINKVTYVGTKHTLPYTFTADETSKFGDVVGMRLYTGSSASNGGNWGSFKSLQIFTASDTVMYIDIGSEQIPANSYRDAYFGYNGWESKTTIQEWLLAMSRKAIWSLDNSTEYSFALIYSYPPSSQG